MMMNRELITMGLTTSTKEDTIRYLSECAYIQNKIGDVDTFFNSVMEREKEFTTYVGNSIAIPHGKSSAVKEPMIVFARLSTPIYWEEEEDSLVDIIFLLGVPKEKAASIHLEILAKLSRKLMDESFTLSLKEATDREEIYTTLTSIL